MRNLCEARSLKPANVSSTNIIALPETTNEPVISVKALKEAIDKDVYELIDVRTHEEHNLFNIGGRHVPVNELENNPSFRKIERAIVVYCSSGKRSGEAAKLIRNKFPEINIFSLEGGLKAWQEDG